MSNQYVEMPPMTVQMSDEEGNEQEYGILAIFPAHTAGIERYYAALVPVVEAADVEMEIQIVRFSLEGQVYSIEGLESEAEWEQAKAAFAPLAAQIWPDDHEILVQGESPLNLSAARPN